MTRHFLYSHDTYGLGHLRRSMLLAEAIVESDPGHEVLIATGSPQAQAFSLPERVDSLKLPSATKDGRGAYRPRKLSGSIDDLIGLRSAVVLAAIGTYAPDVVVVDHAPLGMGGELLPVLDQMAGRGDGPRFVLGVRDIIDDVERVEVDWARSGVWEWLDCYDDILVYGDPRIMTTARELNLASRVRASVAHTGYVAPMMPEPADAREPFLLVTPGGGGDGQVMLRRYLDAVELGATAGMRSVVVTGPLMSSVRRKELRARAEGMPGVELLEFTDRMRNLVASAAGVVSMAGYNTVVEELAADVPALLVPRCHPRLEQDIRARRLERHTRLRYCPVERLTVAAIGEFAERASTSERSRLPRSPIDLNGARNAADLLNLPRAPRTVAAKPLQIGALR